MRATVLLLAGLVVLQGAEKPVPPVQGENDTTEITAEVFTGAEAVSAAIGLDPKVPLIVVKVTVRPKEDNEIKIWQDDFVILSRRDGQRCQAMSPSQIAGQGALVVNVKGMRSTGMSTDNPNRPIWGGIPGSGDRPRKLGGDDAGVSSAAPAEVKSTASDKIKGDNELLDILKSRALPEATTKEAVTGMLYFLLDGKHRLKDLELFYKSGSDRIVIDFVK